MKTLGRISIILTAFAIIMGITYLIVNANSSSSSMSAPEVVSVEGFAPPSRERPELGSGDMPGGSWIFGLVKNVGIVTVIVALIVVPRSFMRRKSVPAQVV